MKVGLIIPGRQYSHFGAPASRPLYHGSSYRIGESLRQLCDLEILEWGHPLLEHDLSRCDAAVVRGDRSMAYALAREIGIPYALLMNDLASMRDPSYQEIDREREMVENAEAAIFVSEPLQTTCAKRYAIPKTSVLVPLRPLARDLDFEPLPKLAGMSLVYAGGIMERNLVGSPWGYRAYHDFFDAAIDGGWDVHVFPALERPRAVAEYTQMGCMVHAPVAEDDVPRLLSQFTAGLQAYNVRGVPSAAVEYAASAWPNKTWLYLAAGIPTISLNPGFESARIIRQGGWGIILSRAADLAKVRRRDLPQITRAMRRANTIDQDLPKLEAVLRAVTAGRCSPKRQRRRTTCQTATTPSGSRSISTTDTPTPDTPSRRRRGARRSRAASSNV